MDYRFEILGMVGGIRQLSIWTTLSLLVFSAGCDCDSIGGGIAGAGRDSASRRQEVENYESTMSANIGESVVDNNVRITPKQHFDDLMRSFPISVSKVREAVIRIPSTDFTAQYKQNRFMLRDGNKLIVEEQLPSVFDMHPVRLGFGTLSGRGIVMIANKSRASTGRYLVAIYSQSGEVLYRRVLSTGQVWDIKAESDVIQIIGAKKTRRITASKGS